MEGKVLILNTGSSSIKFGLYLAASDALLVRGELAGFGTKSCLFSLDRFYKGAPHEGEIAEDRVGEVLEAHPVKVKNVKAAIAFLLDFFLKEKLLGTLKEIVAVGHRVVHGADLYKQAVLVDKDVKRKIKELSRFAPLHNPHNLAGILYCEHFLRGVPNVAVFDTAFHQSMPKKVFLYGCDPKLYEEYRIRKYGFHGTNHKYCAHKAAELLGEMPRRMVTCHLGNGSSITAIKDGISLDTSMGFTPNDGLIMGTRSGAIDPEIVLFLMRELHQHPQKIDTYLNKQSGLKAIAGTNNVELLWQRARKGEARATLALDMLTYQIIKYIGGYAASLHGLDCLVFSGGIGENAWYVRSEVCNSLGHLGVKINTDRNQANEHEISTPDSKVKVFVLKANEELQIGREVAALLAEAQKA